MEICIRSLKRQNIRSLKGQYGSNRIGSWSELAKMLEKNNNESSVFFIKADQIFLKGQYGSTWIVLDSSFSKEDNMGWTVLSFED